MSAPTILLQKILDRIPIPVVPLHEHVTSPRASNRAATPERILQRIDWQVIRRLDGLLQGDYRSLFYGYGVDFADLREYQPEDDIRYIDWNVTARMNMPLRAPVRRRPRDHRLVPARPQPIRGFFGSQQQQKRGVLIDFVTTIARLLTRHGNRVGALGVRIWDPREIELPDVGQIVMEDAETGEQMVVDTSDRKFRTRFQEAAQHRERELSATFQHAGVDLLSLSTQDDLVRAIVRLAELRKQRRRNP
jgi:uncharacterized protein (DUF58 family)